jgi:hypothetical protein
MCPHRNILVETTDLEALRRPGHAYLDTLVDKLIGRLPMKWRNNGTRIPAFKLMVRRVVQDLFQPHPDIPYQIGHRYEGDVWKRMGLYITRDVSTLDIAQVFRIHESENCELISSQRYMVDELDSIHMCTWTETPESMKTGSYWKNQLIQADPSLHETGQIRLKASFLLYGRLKFAQLDDHAPFQFQQFNPAQPSNPKERITGFVTIGVRSEDHVYILEKGQPVTVYDADRTRERPEASTSAIGLATVKREAP